MKIKVIHVGEPYTPYHAYDEDTFSPETIDGKLSASSQAYGKGKTAREAVTDWFDRWEEVK